MDKIVLFQEWPRKKTPGTNRIYDYPGKTTVKVFPANTEGLTEAIDSAERGDAKLIKITKEYYNASKLMRVLRERIRQKRYVMVFQKNYIKPDEIK